MAPQGAIATPFVLAQANAAFANDPYPTYRQLRDTAPLCRQPDGSVFLSRYDDVRAVITDAESFSSDKRVDFLPKFGQSPLYEHHTNSLVFNDPPAHTRVRRLLSPFFSVQAMRRMEAGVAANVDELLDRADESGLEVRVRLDLAQQVLPEGRRGVAPTDGLAHAFLPRLALRDSRPHRDPGH